MALDERQQGIREGAGLEESRLNTEFIDWLKRWGSTFVMICALGALAYAGYRKLEERKSATVDKAFAAYEAVARGATLSPDALENVATDYSSVPGIRRLSWLTAADATFAVARSGLRAGVRPDMGMEITPADLLSDSERLQQFDAAEALYQRVLAETRNDPALSMQAMSAAFGIASVAESKGEIPKMKEYLQLVLSMAEKQKLTQPAKVAKAWLDAPVETAPKLLLASVLPKLPWAEENKPTPPPVGGAPTVEMPLPAPEAAPATQPAPEQPAPDTQPAPEQPAPTAPPATNPPATPPSEPK